MTLTMDNGLKVNQLSIIKVENQLITVALARVNGHREKAAELLGISTRQLKRRITRRRASDEII